MKEYIRDYDLASKVAKLPDDALISSAELAAFWGVSQTSIQTGHIKNLPARVSGLSRKMQWRLGDVREFVHAKTSTHTDQPQQPKQPRRRGRRTKAEEVSGRNK